MDRGDSHHSNHDLSQSSFHLSPTPFRGVMNLEEEDHYHQQQQQQQQHHQQHYRPRPRQPQQQQQEEGEPTTSSFLPSIPTVTSSSFSLSSSSKTPSKPSTTHLAAAAAAAATPLISNRLEDEEEEFPLLSPHSQQPLEASASASLSSSTPDHHHHQDDFFPLVVSSPLAATTATANTASSTPTTTTTTATTPAQMRSRKKTKKTGTTSPHHNHHHQGVHKRRRRHRRGAGKSSSSSPSSKGHHHGHDHDPLLPHHGVATTTAAAAATTTSSRWCWWWSSCWSILLQNRRLSLLSCMNIMAKLLLWSSAVASTAAVIWYSYELKKHGTDPHLIAWFSAGAFVLLGFPISMYGIVMHLANYNQPNVQAYVVRILWMVPIYSIESWLCLRYKDYAIYIETLRDCYESYVLYSFLQFLIQVLGGEEALVLMLKDKSPTRGVHMWGLQWCVKPWLMGQPLRKTYAPSPRHPTTTNTNTIMGTIDNPTANNTINTASGTLTTGTMISPTGEAVTTTAAGAGGITGTATTTNNPTATSGMTTLKRVHWTSPFFVQCKFGVLQYVLLKIVLSIIVMLLELQGLYKEGNFTYKGGYLYICILTNMSQCWALYCMIFFYYATKNELSSIRPVGKFLSVKALVFFTWWQSVCISMLYQMDWFQHYQSGGGGSIFLGGGGGGVGPMMDEDSNDSMDHMMTNTGSNNNNNMFGDATTTSGAFPPSVEEALALDEMGGGVFTSAPVVAAAAAAAASKVTEWSPEDVAKGLQDYLICIEMFVAAIVHIFVFSHTEYDPQAVQARSRALNQQPHKDWNIRLGRKWKEWDNKSGWSGSFNSYDTTSHSHSHSNNNNGSSFLEMTPITMNHHHHHQKPMTPPPPRRRADSDDDDDELMVHPFDSMDNAHQKEIQERRPLLLLEPVQSEGDLEEDELIQNSMHSLSSSELNDQYGNDDGDDDDDDDDGDYTDTEYDDDYDEEEEDYSDSNHDNHHHHHNDNDIERQQQEEQQPFIIKKTGFVKALLDSAIPQDLRDNTVGIIKGEYVVEKKTLLHHAATSDSYDLFSRFSSRKQQRQRPKGGLLVSSSAATHHQNFNNNNNNNTPSPPPPTTTNNNTAKDPNNNAKDPNM